MNIEATVKALQAKESLDSAIYAAGGDPRLAVSLSKLRSMSALELLAICAANRIEFEYVGGVK